MHSLTKPMTLLQVEGLTLPSSPSGISLLPGHSPFVTWQRPFYAHSRVFNTAQRSEDVPQSASPESIRAAVASLESELLQAMNLEALQAAPDGDSSSGQGVPHDKSALADFEGLKAAQQGLVDEARIPPPKPAKTVQEALATMPLVSVHAEVTGQLPAVFAAGNDVSTAVERDSQISHDLAEAGCAEEMGQAQFWQAAVADAEISSVAQHLDTADAAVGASACLNAADLAAAEHAAEASIEEQAHLACSVGKDFSQDALPPEAAKASLHQASPLASPAVEIRNRSALLGEGLMYMMPHHGSPQEVSNVGNRESTLPALRTHGCGSNPPHAAAIAAASTPRSCSTRHHLRSRRVPCAKLSRRRRTLQTPRAPSLRRDHDADILAALLALQMAVSEHSADILKLKHASQPQSCCSLPNSPTQLRGLLTAHLDVAWSGEGSQGATLGSPSHAITAVQPGSKGTADSNAQAVKREQGLPHQPSLAAATEGSASSNNSVGRPGQAEQLQLRPAMKSVPRRLPSAAADTRRGPPSTTSSSVKPQERPGAKQGARQGPMSFNTVLQGWHKERRLQAGTSRK